MLNNSELIAMVKEITVAKLSVSTTEAYNDTGKFAAEFMEQIYNKLSELNQKESK